MKGLTGLIVVYLRQSTVASFCTPIRHAVLFWWAPHRTWENKFDTLTTKLANVSKVFERLSSSVDVRWNLPDLFACWYTVIVPRRSCFFSAESEANVGAFLVMKSFLTILKKTGSHAFSVLWAWLLFDFEFWSFKFSLYLKVANFLVILLVFLKNFSYPRICTRRSTCGVSWWENGSWNHTAKKVRFSIIIFNSFYSFARSFPDH